MSDQSQGPGWWLASDGKWYPPESAVAAAAPPPTSTPTSTETRSERSTGEKLMLGAAAALVVGSFLPWATVGPFEVAGTEGDGQLTLFLGVVAGALVWARKAPRTVLVLLVICLLIGGYDMADIGSVAGDDEALFDVSVGFGLLMVVAAAIVGIVGWVNHRRSAPARPTSE